MCRTIYNTLSLEVRLKKENQHEYKERQFFLNVNINKPPSKKKSCITKQQKKLTTLTPPCACDLALRSTVSLFNVYQPLAKLRSSSASTNHSLTTWFAIAHHSFNVRSLYSFGK